MANLIRLSPAGAQTMGYESSVAASPLEPTLDDEGQPAEESMLDQLDRSDRLRLVEFVCSFAWADFEIQPEERDFIAQLIRRLELGDEDDRQCRSGDLTGALRVAGAERTRG